MEDSPSLRREIPEMIAKQSATAAKLAASDLGEHGERAGLVQKRLEQGGFTADEVLGDWFPETAG